MACLSPPNRTSTFIFPDSSSQTRGSNRTRAAGGPLKPGVRLEWGSRAWPSTDQDADAKTLSCKQKGDYHVAMLALHSRYPGWHSIASKQDVHFHFPELGP